MRKRTRQMLSVTGMLLAGLAGAAVYAGGDGQVNFGRGRQARAKNVILFIGDDMGVSRAAPLSPARRGSGGFFVRPSCASRLRVPAVGS